MIPRRHVSAAPETAGESTDVGRPAPPRGEPEVPTSAAAGPSGARAYAHATEHLDDELAWLDLMIHARVLGMEQREPDPLAALKGLVISSEEVARLLGGGEPARDTGNAVVRLEAAAAERRRAIAARLQATEAAGLLLPLPYLSLLFELGRSEERVLVICAAAELDRRYDKLFAFLHDDVTRRRPSVELALELICTDEAQRRALRSVFDPMAPLRRYRLIEVLETDPPQPLRARALALDERIGGYLLGSPLVDPRIAARVTSVQPGRWNVEGQGVRAPKEAAASLRESARLYFGSRAQERPNLILHLRGADGSGRRHLAACLGEELGLPLLCVDVARREASAASGLPRVELAETLWRAAREALLQPAVLIVESFDELLGDGPDTRAALQALLDAVPQFCRCTALLGERTVDLTDRVGDAAFVEIAVPSGDEAEMASYWRERSETMPLVGSDPAAIASLAGRFHFGRGRVDRALRVAHARASWRSPTDPGITDTDLLQSCRAVSSAALDGLARKIDPRATWEALVLPAEPRSQVRAIASHVRHRHLVLGEWGFGRKLSLGKGVNALFAGPPGTGKTMAAEVVANDLGLDLYKIDLSQVISKYIGETEKNLDRVFAAAERASAILFFDEADALFGKRSEVRDSHDRYANVEISYLLQKMEEYGGIAILATNLRRHLDDAFLRRLQFVIEFPFPDREQREAIWRVTLPPELPLDDSVDLATLAREVKLAGGAIKNICVAAAHLAAADGGRVVMAHLWDAARQEFEKLGRSFEPDPGALP